MDVDQALSRGLISNNDAAKIRSGQRKKRKPGSSTKKASILCSIEGDNPQEKLWRKLVLIFPGEVKSQNLQWECSGVVPGRRYTVDIAFSDQKIAIELDGWEFHGKNLENFKRDREKDRLMTLQGWRVIRFYAKEIQTDLEAVVEQISKLKEMVDLGL